jgi:carboxypeptidase PM20D1
VDGVLAYLEDTIGDERVSVSLLDASEPSRVSDTDCEGYRRVARAAADTWTDCIVSPSLMTARSDSRHYGSISDRVYRFSAYDITKEEAATVHGDNERVRLDALRRSVEFFTRLLLQC